MASLSESQLFIQEIAEQSAVPQAYLAKILKRLNEAGLIESKRGYKGGIWLARSPQKITLWDISVALEGDGFLTQCMLGGASCDDRRDCPVHEFWKKERDRIHNELARITLHDVVVFERGLPGKPPGSAPRN